MKQTISTDTERLRRLLDATPEQQALVDRILEGRPEGRLKPSADSTGAAGDLPAWKREDFIDKPVVAERMGMSERSVDNFMSRGLIPFYRVGRRVMFKWSEVEAHLAANCRVGGRGVN